MICHGSVLWGCKKMNKQTEKLKKLVGTRKNKKVVFKSRDYNQYKTNEATSEYN